MGEYVWDDLNDIYTPVKQKVSKGTVLEISMTCTEPIGTLNIQILESFFNSWTYPHNRRYIRPFRLLEFSNGEKWIKVAIIQIIKNKEVDELKVLFQDILHILNSDHVQVSEIKVNLR